ncbi:TniB family NTP-binding protein [Acidovorax sp.]|uniref:TniB family NTP-binding protein n=1 Tax=Acidovorax sp. TaxID=1872122 RepID=UPI00391F8F6B
MRQTKQYKQVVKANYRPQLQKRYQGNKLIEALPIPLSEEEIVEALSFSPAFDESSRQWPRHDRIRELPSLANLMFPMSAHIELALTLDSLMRDGYIGRRPLSAEHIALYQEIYDDALNPNAFRQTYETVTPKLSGALIGVSGMGKTTTIQRCLARYPRVIYHPELDIYQIPWLHFEMPKDSKGVKALLTSIIEAIAELIPGNTYIDDHVHQRATEQSLQSSVRTLMNKHCVGLLIPDEVQNAANNSRQSDQLVMTALTTLANKSKTPIIFVGTPKAEKVLSADLRQIRRSLRSGLGDWSPLPRYETVADEETSAPRDVEGEWVYFMRSMWVYCWTSTPQILDDDLLDAFYYCTQGILDIAIKLFAAVQARAILDDVHTLSSQLVHSVFDDHFGLVHPVIKALRENDVEALIKYEDVKVLRIEDTIESIQRRRRLLTGRAASARPGTSDFKPRLVNAATSMGMTNDDAQALAEAVESEGTAKNMFDAVAQLAKKAAPPKKTAKVRSRPASKSPDEPLIPTYPGLDGRPDDFRHAIVAAAIAGTSIVEKLFELDLMKEPEDALWAA